MSNQINVVTLLSVVEGDEGIFLLGVEDDAVEGPIIQIEIPTVAINSPSVLKVYESMVETETSPPLAMGVGHILIKLKNLY